MLWTQCRLSRSDYLKLWSFSDLHLEYGPLREALAIPYADFCVVAGNLCRGAANGFCWLAEHIDSLIACVYVAGSHEFYNGSIRECLEECPRAAQGFPGVHFLENDAVAIGGIQFVGATLWTDSASRAVSFSRCGTPRNA